MEILPSVRSREWWEIFWKDLSCDYGAPNETLLEFAKEFYMKLSEREEHLSAVDIASGNGRYAIPLAEMGYDVTLVELATSAIKRAETMARKKGVLIHILQRDYIEILQEQQQFDLVLSSGLLEEVEKEYQERIVEGYKSWTKLGGYVILKYCIEIEGRGVLVGEEVVLNLFRNKDWRIILEKEKDRITPSKAEFTKSRHIDSGIRTGTLIAQKVN